MKTRKRRIRIRIRKGSARTNAAPAAPATHEHRREPDARWIDIPQTGDAWTNRMADPYDGEMTVAQAAMRRAASAAGHRMR